MTIPTEILNANPGLGEWSILTGYRGSIAHGTFVPSDDPDSIDDKDVMAFCVPTKRHYIGLDTFGSRGTKEIMQGEWDVVIYEAKKAIHLLKKGNPNVLSMLWMPENLYIDIKNAGYLLLDNRELFVAKHVYHAYVGYARSQLTKMERGTFEGYMGERRKRLVEEHGYDTKNASHLIRLLRQGIEFLTTGELVVQRPDAAELLAIKKGEWTLERVKEESTRLFDVAETAYIHSPLPPKPDEKKISTLCAHVIELAWKERSE